jgi:hypothetical protein
VRRGLGIAKHLVVGIDWYGPYSLEEAKKSAAQDYDGGLYVCVGKKKGQHHQSLQYVGKSTNNLFKRMTTDHKKLALVSRDREIWLGEIATGSFPGRRKTQTPSSVRFSEWATAYFLRLPLNSRLKGKPPPQSVTVLNRWWKIDYETPRYHRPHSDWPDLIDFLGSDYRARLVWFGTPGKQRSYSPDEITVRT